MYAAKLLSIGISMLSIQATTACNPSSANSSGGFVPGTDGPGPAATLGYAINHIGLATHNLTRLKDFYINTLGMRTLFDAQFTPEYTVTYLGYPQAGRNGTGFQTGAEMLALKNNMYGLLEITQFNVSEAKLLPTTVQTNTFSHIGLIVPDVVKAQKYLKSKGARILKEAGVPLNSTTGAIANAYDMGAAAGAHLAAKERFLKVQGAVGVQEFLMVADPDGNLIEIQGQDW